MLEFIPSRYDKIIRILTFGKLDEIYDYLAAHIMKGCKVLDIGCGTGALTLRAAWKGARVKAIDINPQMLEVARKRVSEAGLIQNIDFYEMGVAELESEEHGSYDVVTSGLCLSELTEEELTYTLKEVKRILKPGGLLLVADEVKPKNTLKRIIYWLIRFPLVAVTYLIAQATTKPVEDLLEKIEESGLIIESVKLNKLENFMVVVARKPRKEKREVKRSGVE